MFTFRIIYTAGCVGVDDRGAVRISWRAQAGLSDPQLNNPGGDGYLAVHVVSDGTVRPQATFEPRGHRRPFVPAITVKTDDGGLWPGDRIELTFGDTTAGGAGLRAPVTVVQAHEFQISVDCKGAQEFLDLEGVLDFRVVAGVAQRLVAVAPSDVQVGVPFSIRARFEDEWGNPVEKVEADITVTSLEEGAFLSTGTGSGPVISIDGLVLNEPGVVRLSVQDAATGLTAISNPIRLSKELPELRRWWGDLHGQSGESVGTNPSSAYFHYARHIACVDFTCHQANDFQVTDEFWERLRGEVEEIHADGVFVCFHGYEWSGNTEVGGDRNVIFRGVPASTDLVRSGHWLIEDRCPVGERDASNIEELYEQLSGRDDVMLLPHVGGRRSHLQWLRPDLEPVVEVHSAHGTSEWFLQQAVATGKRIGFVAGSDDHMGRPGATLANNSEMPVQGGLACVRAFGLTRNDIWEALQRRDCYGTTGSRILVETEVGGVRMGESALVKGDVLVTAEINGTASIIEIAVYRDAELVHRWCPQGDPSRLLIAWTGNVRIARGRKQTWDGSLAMRGASIMNVLPVAFDHIEEGLIAHDEHSVSWKSKTAGDYDGVLVELEKIGHAPSVKFVSEPLTVEQPISEAVNGPIFVDASGVGAHVRFQALPAVDHAHDAVLSWSDETADPGTHAYHVRVLQIDGHMAWSSPTYVDVKPD